MGLLWSLQSTGAIASLIKSMQDKPEMVGIMHPTHAEGLQQTEQQDAAYVPSCWLPAEEYAGPNHILCNYAQLLGVNFTPLQPDREEKVCSALMCSRQAFLFTMLTSKAGACAAKTTLCQ